MTRFNSKLQLVIALAALLGLAACGDEALTAEQTVGKSCSKSVNRAGISGGSIS